MNRIISAKVWDEISTIAKKSTTKLAAIAYVTDDTKICFGKGDTLIVDASDSAIETAQTSVRVLQDALKRGAALYSCANLHSKLLVLDRTVVVGSANMSKRSAHSLIEAALISDYPGTLATARAFITKLAEASAVIDTKFLQRIAKLPVVRPKVPDTTAGPGPRSIVIPESRTWLLGIHDLDLDRYTHEDDLAEQGTRAAEESRSSPEEEISWIRFTGNSKFRREAQPGDQVIQIWRESVHDAPKAVYRHTPIVYRLDQAPWTRFYLASFEDEEQHTLSLPSFQQLLKKVGIEGRIGKWTTREIKSTCSEALWSLWDEHKRLRKK